MRVSVWTAALLWVTGPKDGACDAAAGAAGEGDSPCLALEIEVLDGGHKRLEHKVKLYDVTWAASGD